jgi:hypothetical protein
MIDKLSNILLVILVILIIFCVGTYLYSGGNISTILEYDRFDNVIDRNKYLLDLMAIAKQQAKKIIREKFAIDQNQILQNDAQNYNDSLNTLQVWLDENYNGDYGIMAKIKAEIQNTSEIREMDKQALLNLLTNIYIINYVNYINKQNAESYKMFLKYNDIKKNKYYNQYQK